MSSKRISEIEFIEIFSARIFKELKAAAQKHPKFCDAFLDPDSRMSWAESEYRVKARNARTKEYADNILMEEIAEAFNAYSNGDLEHALLEFAQCGAVVVRCMQYITNQLDQEQKGTQN